MRLLVDPGVVSCLVRSFLVGTLVSSVYGQNIDPLNNFCLRWDQQSAVLDGKIYIDGGVQTFWQGSTRDTSQNGNISIGTNRNLISLTLGDSWNWRNLTTMPFQILDADQRVASNALAPPTLTSAALWSYNNSLFLYGGTTSRLNDSFVGYQSPTSEDTVMWKFNVGTSQWAPVELTVNGGKMPRLASGASAVAEDKGLAFYYGGQVDNGTSPDTANNSGVRYSNEFFVFNLGNGSVQSLPVDAMAVNGISGAQMVYIPYIGKKGILVLFGGSLKPAGVIDNKFRGEMIPMSDISVFDIASLGTGAQGWYNQTATGDVPVARFDFCLVTVPAPDKSSYNIYLYGGWDGVNKYDDVYILSLPSFEWISMFTGADERERHSCHLVGNRMMMTIGGHKARLGLPGECDWEPNGIALFDMVNATWPNVYDPTGPAYNISSIISRRIGGGDTGGATRVPKSWAPGLEQVFYPQNTTNSTIPTSTPTPVPKPSGKPSKSTIIGGSVGGTVAVLVIALAAFQIYKIRRAAYNRVRLGGLPPAELEPSTKMPLSAFQELLGSLGKNRNARAAMELPGSLPNHVPARDSNGNPFELPGMGENNMNDASQPEMSQPDVSQPVGTSVVEEEPVDRESTEVENPISDTNPDADAGEINPGSNRHSISLSLSSSSAQAQEKVNMNWI